MRLAGEDVTPLEFLRDVLGALVLVAALWVLYVLLVAVFGR